MASAKQIAWRKKFSKLYGKKKTGGKSKQAKEAAKRIRGLKEHLGVGDTAAKSKFPKGEALRRYRELIKRIEKLEKKSS